ncbi:hypothetical protein MRX96_002009 [Rhipicephalus microplus]
MLDAEAVLDQASLVHLCKGAGTQGDSLTANITVNLQRQLELKSGAVFSVKCLGSTKRDGTLCFSCKYLRKALITRQSRIRKRHKTSRACSSTVKKLKVCARRNKRLMDAKKTQPPPPPPPAAAPEPPKPAGPSDEDWVFKPPGIWKGHDVSDLPKKVRYFVEEQRRLCQPANVYVCDGSIEEHEVIMAFMVKLGLAVKLKKQANCYLVRTDPRDVARVEGRTCIATARKEDTVPIAAPGVKGILGNWIAPEELRKILSECMPGCMKGRTMFVIPFSMCPVESPLSRLGIQVTDSPYVVASMRTMTRMGGQGSGCH